MGATVIIPNLNGARVLGACLDSLRAQTRPPAAVVVVDNGSRDRSAELAETHPLGARVLRLGRNQGFAAAANRGIEAAGATAIALLNSDAVADPRWLEAGLAALERRPAAAIVASLMLDFSDRDRVDSAGDFLPKDGRPQARGRGRRAAEAFDPAPVLSACAGAAFYRRDLFAEIGGFEESFFAYLEDLDLCLRARAAGHQVWLEPRAVVYHHGASADLGDRPGKKPVDSSLRVRLIARNRVRLLARHLPAAKLFADSPWLALGLARSAAYHLLRSRQSAAFFAGLREGLGCFRADRADFASRPAPAPDWRRRLEEEARPWPR